MKMAEFLALSDDEKVDVLDDAEGNYKKATEDIGVCSQYGGPADVGDFCFGCHKLICEKCFEIEPHLSECVAKPIKQ